MLANKLAQIQASLKTMDLQGLIICNVSHEIHDDILYYLLLKHLERGLLIIPAKGKPTLYAIPFEASDLETAHPELRVLPMTAPIPALVAKHLRVGMSAGYRGILPAPLFAALKKQYKLRLWNDPLVMGIKTPAEVAALQQAADITDIIFQSLLKNWHKFKTERDVAQFIHIETLRHGFEPSFPAIVASGANAASPHHEPTDIKLKRGFCVIDMGVRAQGYCSDMTRTIFLGAPSAKERELYQTLLEVQTSLIASVRPDMPAAFVDTTCRQMLGDLEPLFIHGLGHGVGTQVHEWPSVSSKSDATLREGIVITIEPGMYKKNAYGIRIEDDIVIGKNGARILTQTPKKLIIIS